MTFELTDAEARLNISCLSQVAKEYETKALKAGGVARPFFEKGSYSLRSLYGKLSQQMKEQEDQS